MFGELSATETICHLIITNNLEECIFSIPSPFDESGSIDLYITQDKPTKNSVTFVNGAPYIKTNVRLNARILSANKNSNYFEGDNLDIINSYATSYVKSELERYLYKTAKDYKSDISLFGKYAVSHFNTWNEWLKYDWLDSYENSFFEINADVNVLSSYLIS